MLRFRLAAVVVATICATSVVTAASASTTFPTRAEALSRPHVVVASGTTGSQYRIASPPADTTYDLRTLKSTAYPTTTTYPLSFGSGTPGTRTAVVGGTVQGTAPASATWQQLKTNDDGTALLMFGQDQIVSYGLQGDDVFDFFRPRPPSGNLDGASFLLADCHGSNIRDDAVENDHEMTGTIRGCVFDGINSGVSIGQNETNPDAVTTIEDSTFIFKAMPNLNAPDGVGHAVLFKQMGGGRVVMNNDLVCYPETPIGPSRLTNWMPGSYANVTIVLGPGFDGDGDGDVTDLDYPGTLPPGVTQTRDWSKCGASSPPPAPSPAPTPSPTPSPTPAPSPHAIGALSPSSGRTGSSVTITGSGFASATSVRFNGTTANFTVRDDGHIVASVPSGATSGPVSVRTSAASAASSSAFTVLRTPTIAALTPTSGAIGTSLMITGSGFAGATAVTIGSTAAPFTVTGDGTLTATVPTGAVSAPVSIVTPGGTASSGDAFVVTDGTPTLTVPASADAYVAANRDRRSFGSTRTLNLNGKPAKNILLRFTVSGIGSGSTTGATLRLYCVHGSRGGGHVYRVLDDAWAESHVSWTRAPSGGKDAIGVLGRVRSNRWYDVDVSSVVTGDGTYTFRLRAPSAARTRYMARDGDPARQPQLMISLG